MVRVYPAPKRCSLGQESIKIILFFIKLLVKCKLFMEAICVVTGISNFSIEHVIIDFEGVRKMGFSLLSVIYIPFFVLLKLSDFNL